MNWQTNIVPVIEDKTEWDIPQSNGLYKTNIGLFGGPGNKCQWWLRESARCGIDIPIRGGGIGAMIPFEFVMRVGPDGKAWRAKTKFQSEQDGQQRIIFPGLRRKCSGSAGVPRTMRCYACGIGILNIMIFYANSATSSINYIKYANCSINSQQSQPGIIRTKPADRAQKAILSIDNYLNNGYYSLQIRVIWLLLRNLNATGTSIKDIRIGTPSTQKRTPLPHRGSPLKCNISAHSTHRGCNHIPRVCSISN